MIETTVFPKTSKDDLRMFVNLVFHDKTPGARVFACMGGLDSGAQFRKSMKMSETEVEKWKDIVNGEDKSAPLRYPVCSKDLELVLDTFNETEEVNVCPNENAFMCLTSSFTSIPNKKIQKRRLNSYVRKAKTVSMHKFIFFFTNP